MNYVCISISIWQVQGASYAAMLYKENNLTIHTLKYTIVDNC